MKLVAASFAWPFRGAWGTRFAVGTLMALLMPITFIPLLGYSVEATRRAEDDPTQPPPPWRLSSRLISDGFWIAVVVVLVSAPFAVVLNPLANTIHLAQAYAHIAAAFVLALPWGLVLLLVMPHGTSSFAATGRPRDLFDFPAALRKVKRDFPTWNLVAAAIVTAWIIAVACVGLICVGLFPGIFYAILVSAYASATLHPTNASGISGPHPPAG
ncbi:MAG TPA: DUF4013 domain-containing protein [Candidatus Dormibacteraeota bacterium]